MITALIPPEEGTKTLVYSSLEVAELDLSVEVITALMPPEEGSKTLVSL